MRTALYVRVSTDEQAREGLSLEAQRAALQQYAKEHGLSVVGLYEDDGVSARASYRKREAFSRLLEDVRQDKIDLILFIKLDRWFRDVAGYYDVQKVLEAHGVQWNAIFEEYDTTTANGRLHLNIKLSIAQDEADRTSERVKFVMDLKRAKGEYVGSAPLGYTKRDSQLLVDPEKHPAVRDMFETFISTRSLWATQTMLREKYGIALSRPGVKCALKNQHYVELGDIDEKTLRTVTEIMLSRSQRNTAKRTYIFSGLAYCSQCGGRMYSTTAGNGKKNYRCSTHREYMACTQNSVAEAKLEAELLAALPDEVHEQNLRITEAKKNAPDEATIRRKMDKLKGLYMEDLISKEVYAEDYRALQNQLELIKVPGAVDEGELVSVLQLYEDFSPEERRAFWSRVIRRIYIKPGARTDPRLEKILFL